MAPFVPIQQRLETRRFIDENNCWNWTGSRFRQGYGRIVMSEDGKKRWRPVHRVAWEYYRGPIKDGLELDHLCQNKACFNPDHLEPVTGRENIRRYITNRTGCKNGHPYEDGSYRLRSQTDRKTGANYTYRECIVCSRANAKRTWLRNKQSKPSSC